MKHVSTDMQRADVLTKALALVKFERMRRLLGKRICIKGLVYGGIC